MARPANFHPPQPTRSDEFDNYYDARACHPHTKAFYGRGWTHENFRDTTNNADIDLSLENGRWTNAIPDCSGPAHRRDSQTASLPKVWSARIDHEFHAREPAEQNHRIAEWVETQQVSEHVTLSLDSFESMIDHLIATEEALDNLKSAAFSCVREAYSGMETT